MGYNIERSEDSPRVFVPASSACVYSGLLWALFSMSIIWIPLKLFAGMSITLNNKIDTSSTAPIHVRIVGDVYFLECQCPDSHLEGYCVPNMQAQSRWLALAFPELTLEVRSSIQKIEIATRVKYCSGSSIVPITPQAGASTCRLKYGTK